jgi:hypothetical protein
MFTRSKRYNLERTSAWNAVANKMKRDLLSPNVNNFKSKLNALRALSMTSTNLHAKSDIRRFKHLLHSTLLRRIQNGDTRALRQMLEIDKNKQHIHRYQRMVENVQRERVFNRFKRKMGNIVNKEPHHGAFILRTTRGSFLFHNPPSNFQMYKITPRLPRFGAFMQPFNVRQRANGNGWEVVLLPRNANYRVRRNRTNAFNSNA